MKTILLTVSFWIICIGMFGQTKQENKIDSLHSNNSLPVGTIITSMLNFDTFTYYANDIRSLLWNPLKSKWAPADGRNIEGSQYSKAIKRKTLPDLRGMFIRGLNSFDPNEQSASQVDPENRSVGNKQDATVFSYNGAEGSHSPKGDAVWFSGNTGFSKLHNHTNIENRPVNIAIYYYIKIN